MDVISTVLLTVVFLFEPGTQVSNPPVPIGTGFVIQYPTPKDPTKYVPIIITAKHVIGDKSKILVRFNTKHESKPVYVLFDLKKAINDNDFWEHPDEGVDIVAFRTLHYDITKYEAIPKDIIATKDIMADEDIKASAAVIFPGLLINFLGENTNHPILKDGTIALIPSETIPFRFNCGNKEINTKQDLILVNTISIPGLSGSPVFLSPHPRLKKNTYTFGGKSYLLGVMHGFFPALPRQTIKVETTEARYFYQDNSGIAIVFPAWRILEIFNTEPFQKRVTELLSSTE
jgi:hypothetical protein